MKKSHPEKVRIDYEVRNPQGKVVKTGTFPFRSFLTNYYTLIQRLMAFAAGGANATVTVKDTSGNNKTVYQNGSTENQILPTQDIAADNTYGIQVGTGNAANTGSTSALSTLIAHGNGANQLSYGSMGITAPSGTTPFSFTLTRTFTNNSGGTINITELGLVVAIQDTSPATVFIMITRDVFSAVSVLNGNNITFTLTLSYTIS